MELPEEMIETWEGAALVGDRERWREAYNEKPGRE